MIYVCTHCGTIISYQKAHQGGLCNKCKDGRGYRMRADIPGGLYAPVLLIHNMVVWTDAPILYSHEVKAALRNDAIRIGQILERWTPYMQQGETGELFQVADHKGKLVIQEYGRVAA